MESHRVNSIISGGSPPLHCTLTMQGHQNIQCVVCVCVFSSHSFWTSSLLDVPAEVTQENGHRISHPPSFCGACLNFFASRIQPFLSLVDCEVEIYVLTI